MNTQLALSPFVLGAFYIAHAAATPAAVVLKPTVAPYAELIQWVETREGLKLEPLPHIIIVNDNAFKERVGESVEYGSNIEGAEAAGNIIIDDTVSNIGEIAKSALIVHELTHYAQEISGKKYECQGQREAEAFANQNRYLAEHNRLQAMPDYEIQQMKECQI